MAAAAAFYEKATMLTLDPEHRAERALAAAATHIEAGAFDAALDLLTTAERGPLTDLQSAALACCTPSSSTSPAAAAMLCRCS